MPNDSFARELRAEMARQGVSQDELGRRLQKSQSWISRRVTGAVGPTVTDLREIAAALSVPASQFLADEPV